MFVLNMLRAISFFYKGMFSEGLMHGRGTYTWADGVTYEVILIEIITEVWLPSLVTSGIGDSGTEHWEGRGEGINCDKFSLYVFHRVILQ